VTHQQLGDPEVFLENPQEVDLPERRNHIGEVLHNVHEGYLNQLQVGKHITENAFSVRMLLKKFPSHALPKFGNFQSGQHGRILPNASNAYFISKPLADRLSLSAVRGYSPTGRRKHRNHLSGRRRRCHTCTQECN
jgi:hypothetical protein